MQHIDWEETFQQTSELDYFFYCKNANTNTLQWYILISEPRSEVRVAYMHIDVDVIKLYLSNGRQGETWLIDKARNNL